MFAIIRSNFKVNPEELSIESFCSLSAEALYLEELKVKQFETALKNVLVELFNSET